MVKLKVGVSRQEFEEGKIRQSLGKFGDIAELDIKIKCFITFKYAESAAIAAKENFPYYIVERPTVFLELLLILKPYKPLLTKKMFHFSLTLTMI